MFGYLASPIDFERSQWHAYWKVTITGHGHSLFDPLTAYRWNGSEEDALDIQAVNMVALMSADFLVIIAGKSIGIWKELGMAEAWGIPAAVVDEPIVGDWPPSEEGIGPELEGKPSVSLAGVTRLKDREELLEWLGTIGRSKHVKRKDQP